MHQSSHFQLRINQLFCVIQERLSILLSFQISQSSHFAMPNTYCTLSLHRSYIITDKAAHDF